SALHAASQSPRPRSRSALSRGGSAAEVVVASIARQNVPTNSRCERRECSIDRTDCSADIAEFLECRQGAPQQMGVPLPAIDMTRTECWLQSARLPGRTRAAIVTNRTVVSVGVIGPGVAALKRTATTTSSDTT